MTVANYPQRETIVRVPNGLEMKYFVLKPGGNDMYAAASRAALLAYADAVEAINIPLAQDLRNWVDRIELDHRWIMQQAAEEGGK